MTYTVIIMLLNQPRAWNTAICAAAANNNGQASSIIYLQGCSVSDFC